MIAAPAGQLATVALTFGLEYAIFENVHVNSAADPDVELYADNLIDFPTQFPSPVEELAVRESVTVMVSM